MTTVEPVVLCAPVPQLEQPKAEPTIWRPHRGPQESFLATQAHEVLYGGAAGGGKSEVLIVGPLRWVQYPGFRALILRRTTVELENLLDKAATKYPALGGKFNANNSIWRFPSGARIRFAHCQHTKDAFKYQGNEFQFIGIDELTHFEWDQYKELKTRVRSTTPALPKIIRCTSNPGGSGHAWVFARWGAWLDPDFEAPGLDVRRHPVTGVRLPPALPNQVLYVLKEVDDAGEREVYVPRGTPDALSRVFIPAKLADNPSLAVNDAGYLSRLRDNDPLRRKQLEEGDWLAKPGAGIYFKRAWLPIIPVAPAIAWRVRYWDRASSTRKRGDFTGGVRIAYTPDGLFTVEHVMRLKGAPGDVLATIKATAAMDGPSVVQVLEVDPGQAGQFEMYQYMKELAGFTVRTVVPSGDKVTRIGPASTQAQAGNFRIVKGPWNNAYIEEMEAFPDGAHDDQADGTSGAVNFLSAPATRRALPEGHGV